MVIELTIEQKCAIIDEIKVVYQESLAYVKDLRERGKDIPDIFSTGQVIDICDKCNKEMEEHIQRLANDMLCIDNKVYNKLLGVLLLKDSEDHVGLIVQALCNILTPNDSEVE